MPWQMRWMCSLMWATRCGAATGGHPLSWPPFHGPHDPHVRAGILRIGRFHSSLDRSTTIMAANAHHLAVHACFGDLTHLLELGRQAEEGSWQAPSDAPELLSLLETAVRLDAATPFRRLVPLVAPAWTAAASGELRSLAARLFHHAVQLGRAQVLAHMLQQSAAAAGPAAEQRLAAMAAEAAAAAGEAPDAAGSSSSRLPDPLAPLYCADSAAQALALSMALAARQPACLRLLMAAGAPVSSHHIRKAVLLRRPALLNALLEGAPRPLPAPPAVREGTTLRVPCDDPLEDYSCPLLALLGEHARRVRAG